MFISAARNDVGDVETVSHANNAHHWGDGQHDKQTDDDCLQIQVTVQCAPHIIQTSVGSVKHYGDSVTALILHSGSALVLINKVNLTWQNPIQVVIIHQWIWTVWKHRPWKESSLAEVHRCCEQNHWATSVYNGASYDNSCQSHSIDKQTDPASLTPDTDSTMSLMTASPATQLPYHLTCNSQS